MGLSLNSDNEGLYGDCLKAWLSNVVVERLDSEVK